MKQSKQAVSTAAVLLSLLAGMTVMTASRADDEDTVDYRQHVMKTMGEQVAMLGMMIEKKAPADDFAKHAEALALSAATAKFAFEPEIEGGESKAEVWSEWDDFAKRMDALASSTADLAKTAKAGGMAAAAPKMRTALTCKGCHDKYREEKK
jgi:cytochrome c556